MKLQTIKVSEAFKSKTNPRGNNFSGQEFDDLVASVKEKGVLVPVIARPVNMGEKFYEIVAGNRRYQAALVAGLKEIPARIDEMTDNEAREIQIIENLQRADVHPLEEGASYRQLAEKSHYEISSIAAKVGKSEAYIRQRLFLTNLSEKPAAAYRSGKITDGHAVLIAKLSAGDQLAALKEATNYNELLPVKRLKEWIDENINSPISRQPWVGNKELDKVVGPCVECKPVSASLFGPVKSGTCNDLKCWKRKMTAYVNYQAQKDKLAKVSDEYSYSYKKEQPEKGVINKNNYTTIEKKEKRCPSTRPAIISFGSGIGKEINICSNPKCEIHHGHSSYEKTPKEKEESKKERIKAAEEKIKRNDNLKTALEKIEWPLSDEHFEALLELAFNQAGFASERSICKRHEIKVEKKTDKYNYTSYPYAEELKKAAAAMDKTQKIRLIFELIIDTGDYLRETKSFGKF